MSVVTSRTTDLVLRGLLVACIVYIFVHGALTAKQFQAVVFAGMAYLTIRGRQW